MHGLGASAVLAHASNQPGWDLLVGHGVEVNVKAVEHASSLAPHFAHYPDIPVVVPADMQAIPHDAIVLDSSAALHRFESLASSGHEHLVGVDPYLSHAGVVDQARGALARRNARYAT